MLKTNIIHPPLMAGLALCGHGSKILIADANYPLEEKSGSAKKIYLGLIPGVPTATQVLAAIHSVCEIEEASVMMPEEGPEPEIFQEFRRELGNIELSKLDRFAFYEACMEERAVCLAISTGEKRVFSNILLTVGCA